MHSPENGFVQLLTNANLQVTAFFFFGKFILHLRVHNHKCIIYCSVANSKFNPNYLFNPNPCIKVCIIVNELLRKLGVTAYFYRKNSLSFLKKKPDA